MADIVNNKTNNKTKTAIALHVKSSILGENYFLPRSAYQKLSNILWKLKINI